MQGMAFEISVVIARPAADVFAMSGQPVGFTRLTWPVIIRAGRKQYEAEFAALKRVLESQA
jgi:hypothetical protein